MWATLKGIANSGQHMDMAEQVPDTASFLKSVLCRSYSVGNVSSIKLIRKYITIRS